MNKAKIKNILLGLTLLVLLPVGLFSHCEVPCGIYDDDLRIQLMKEHTGTVKKAIVNINTLSKDPSKNQNQLVRWTVNKESHATEIQGIVSQYFLTQRIKSDAKGYEKKLAALHSILVYAMKTKQGTDEATADKLLQAIEAFEKLYKG